MLEDLYKPDRKTELAQAIDNHTASKKNLHFDDQSKQVISFVSLQNYLKEIENMFSMFLWSFGIDLLAFFYKCCSLIGYHTHYLFCDRQ